MNIIEQPLDLGNIVDSEVEYHSSYIVITHVTTAILKATLTYFPSAGQTQHSSAHVFCAGIRRQRPRQRSRRRAKQADHLHLYW